MRGLIFENQTRSPTTPYGKTQAADNMEWSTPPPLHMIKTSKIIGRNSIWSGQEGLATSPYVQKPKGIHMEWSSFENENRASNLQNSTCRYGSPGASHSSHIRLRTCSQGDFLQRLTPATATSSAGSQPSALVVHGGGGPSTEAVPEVVPPARQPSLELHLPVQVGWLSSDGLKSLCGAIPHGGVAH